MTIKQGDNIKVDYTGTLDDGTVFDSSENGEDPHPLEFEAGSGKVIKGFDDVVIGMEKGEEKEIKIQPEDAYGQPNPQLVQKVPKDQLPEGQTPEVGMVVAVGLPNNQEVPAKIIEVADEDITLDLNHPLAGQVLNFKIKIVDCS